MTISLSSNISSLRALRQLDRSTQRLGESSARLSSGQRITKASDDAAGLSIHATLKSQSRLFTKAISNINDGVSALSIAEGAIGSLTTITTRIQELATQAANGTYSSTQRQALNSEAQSLSQEYNRILEVTKFNGVTLLSGNSRIQLQVGTNGTDAPLTVGISGLNYFGANPYSAVFDGANDYIAVTDSASIDLGTSDMTLEAWVKSTAPTATNIAIAAKSNGSGTSGYQLYLMSNGQYQAYIGDGPDGAIALSSASTYENDNTWHHVAMVRQGTQLNLYVDGTLSGTADASAVGNLDSARDLIIGGQPTSNSPSTVGALFTGGIEEVRVSSTARYTANFAPQRGEFATDGFTRALYHLNEGSGTTATDSSGNGNTGSIQGGMLFSTDTSLAITSFTLETRQDAANTIDTMNSLLVTLGTQAGLIGAQQSRLNTALGSLAVNRENYEAAASRIADVDVAHETASYFSLQIAQQTSAAILAQANQLPGLALQLLR